MKQLAHNSSLSDENWSVLRTLRRRYQTIWLYDLARGRKSHSLEADRAIEADAEITSIDCEAGEGLRSSAIFFMGVKNIDGLFPAVEECGQTIRSQSSRGDELP